MITFLGTEDGIESIRGACPFVDPLSGDRFELVTYRDAIRRGDWHSGAIIFGDLERLYIAETVFATRLWQRFAKSGARVRLLNHPTRTLRRFALLRKLHTMGINDFDVWRADEIRAGVRFPVFLHGERDHNGPIGGLLRDKAALDRTLGELAEQGYSLNHMLVTEFCDTRGADGLYRKFGTFRVGDRLVHRHLYHSIDWSVKYRGGRVGPEHSPAAIIDEEEEFMLADRFEPSLAEIFRLGAVDYGRMDYSFKDGGIRVWEINTNPMLGKPELNQPGMEIFDRYVARSFDQMREALLALDPDRDDSPFWIEPVRDRQPSAAVPAARGTGWRRLFGARRSRGAGARP
jgi:hypothetical protein